MIEMVLKFIASLLGLSGRSTPLAASKVNEPTVPAQRPTPTAAYRLHVPRSLARRLRQVTRPNEDRGEPLAFLRVRFASEESRTVIVGIDVLPFPDIAYVEGPAGANFATDWAVDIANQQARSNAGLVLVHSHGGRGMPAFSGVDARTNREVMGSLAIGMHTIPYGALVLSDTHACCVLAVAGKLQPVNVIEVPDRFEEVRVTA